MLPFGQRLTDAEELEIAHKVRTAHNFGQLCTIFGYIHEEYVITTDDGYLLLLHRILPKDTGQASVDMRRLQRRPVAYFQHGLLTNSELFMRVTDSRKCLPLVFVERGYDVWLGNNRGNKYSRNHVEKDVKSSDFWDFCIDDFARHDIPTSIDFVLNFTRCTKLSYIGFSQGTAQAFAALSIFPELNNKIDIFVALAPILLPSGYSSSFLNSTVRNEPSFIFRLFGRKSMFSSVAMWQSILPAFILHRIVDVALIHLLGFYNHNITKTQKIASYTHIYCSSSVKAVVHWTQIMRGSVFGTYDSSKDGPNSSNATITRYPTEDIRTPIVLIYGDRDTLFDLDTVRKNLPPRITSRRLVGYEHLDVLWGANVHEDVIPKVFEALSLSTG